MENNHVIAVGGYFLSSEGLTVYPGMVSLMIEESEGHWEEVAGDERQYQRNGFMTAHVPLSWVQKNSFKGVHFVKTI